MRRVFRLDLPSDAIRYLGGRQQRADDARVAGVFDVDKAWRSAAQTKKVKIVRATLKRMAGGRQRCMYCSDSAGTDIGLLGWCFRGNGINESPLSDLRVKHPTVWAACEQEFRNI